MKPICRNENLNPADAQNIQRNRDAIKGSQPVTTGINRPLTLSNTHTDNLLNSLNIPQGVTKTTKRRYEEIDSQNGAKKNIRRSNADDNADVNTVLEEILPILDSNPNGYAHDHAYNQPEQMRGQAQAELQQAQALMRSQAHAQHQATLRAQQAEAQALRAQQQAEAQAIRAQQAQRLQQQIQVWNSRIKPLNTQILTRLERRLTLEGITKVRLQNLHCPEEDHPLDSYDESILRERKNLAKFGFLSDQPITDVDRCRVVEWLHQISSNLGLKQETYLLSVNIFDRFLEIRRLESSRVIRLIALVGLFIASKCEEVSYENINAYIQQGNLGGVNLNATQDEIISTESLMLNMLEFRFTIHYNIRFMERMLRVIYNAFWPAAYLDDTIYNTGAGNMYNSDVGTSAYSPHRNTSTTFKTVREIGNFICEFSAYYYEFCQYPPSLIGCCAAVIAASFYDHEYWSPVMEMFSGYHSGHLRDILSDFANAFRKCKFDQQKSSDFKSVCRKYDGFSAAVIEQLTIPGRMESLIRSLDYYQNQPIHP